MPSAVLFKHILYSLKLILCKSRLLALFMHLQSDLYQSDWRHVYCYVNPVFALPQMLLHNRIIKRRKKSDNNSMSPFFFSPGVRVHLRVVPLRDAPRRQPHRLRAHHHHQAGVALTVGRLPCLHLHAGHRCHLLRHCHLCALQ